MTTAMERARKNAIDEGTLRQLATMSFDDVVKQVHSIDDVDVLDTSDLGDGFQLLASGDKKKLVNVPMIILDYRFITSEKFAGEYVTVAAKLATGDAIRFNDGSTGVYRQLKSLFESTGKVQPIRVPHGLKASEYEVLDEDGKPVIDPNTKRPIQATTYFLDTSL